MTDTFEYAEITAGGHKYYLCIKTKYDYFTHLPESHSLDLGGNVQIVVGVPSHVDDTRYDMINAAKKNAHIIWVGYSTQCSVAEDLPSGDGTRHMLRTAMTIVLDRYDWINKVRLTDASSIECIEKIHVSLPILSLSTNGKSYYEKYFHAHLEKNLMHNEYKESVDKLKSEHMLSFNDFSVYIKNPDTVKYVKPIYALSKSYIDFFKRLKKQCAEDGKLYCVITMDWLELFINTILNNDVNNFWSLSWIIDKERVSRVPGASI